MELGSLPERYLVGSVLKDIKKQNKDMVFGAGVGQDFSLIDGIISADGAGDTPFIAFTKAINNFSCSLGEVSGARITMMLPEKTKDSHIKKFMKAFNDLATEYNIQILGGHSLVTKDVAKSKFVVTILGKEGSYRHNKKAVLKDYDIVMLGEVGMLGTRLLIENEAETLSKRFASSYLQGYLSKYSDSDYSISKVATMLKAYNDNNKENICYIHDVSHGGVFSALWQLGCFMDKGFEVNLSKLPIKQETIEISEYFDINPYLLEGTGAVFVVAKNGNDLIKSIDLPGDVKVVVGKVTDNKEKIILAGENDKRVLAPVGHDEIYRIKV